MKNLLFTLLLLVSTLVPANADTHGGTISGMVADAGNNLEIPGATVCLLPVGARCASNELGAFSFSDLPGGQYTLAVNCIGYAPDTQTVVVRDHESIYLKISLQPAVFQLEDVEVSIQQSRPLGTLSQVDLHTRPVNNTQDMLRFVPGLVIAQHAGGGKAEQIFLRGKTARTSA